MVYLRIMMMKPPGICEGRICQWWW